MKSIYWFRNDLRLEDNAALNSALNNSDHILFVHIDDDMNDAECEWQFPRRGQHRKIFMYQGLEELQLNLKSYGHYLNRFVGKTNLIFQELINRHHINSVYCESINAFEEQAQERLIKELGVNLYSYYQSSMYMPHQLPFDIKDLPDVFTHFRKNIETTGIVPEEPIALSGQIKNTIPILDSKTNLTQELTEDYSQSSFPISDKKFKGGEQTAQLHIDQYFQSDYPNSYKFSRNNLMGIECSTKFSPWLSLGFISANQIYSALKRYEQRNSANDSTYWIYFELLWRDYFRFLFMKYGKNFFYKNGLGRSNKSFQHNEEKFNEWKNGKTPSSFINAGISELNQTGFISNRMRQILASYLVNEFACDWRAGAAWFEHQLIDYDVYSNYGNWSYIAGVGTDPRGGRHFNVDKQKNTYDPDGSYEKEWIKL